MLCWQKDEVLNRVSALFRQTTYLKHLKSLVHELSDSLQIITLLLNNHLMWWITCTNCHNNFHIRWNPMILFFNYLMAISITKWHCYMRPCSRIWWVKQYSDHLYLITSSFNWNAGSRMGKCQHDWGRAPPIGKCSSWHLKRTFCSALRILRPPPQLLHCLLLPRTLPRKFCTGLWWSKLCRTGPV